MLFLRYLSGLLFDFYHFLKFNCPHSTTFLMFQHFYFFYKQLFTIFKHPSNFFNKLYFFLTVKPAIFPLQQFSSMCQKICKHLPQHNRHLLRSRCEHSKVTLRQAMTVHFYRILFCGWWTVHLTHELLANEIHRKQQSQMNACWAKRQLQFCWT